MNKSATGTLKHYILDGSVAVAALWAKLFVIVQMTVGQSVLLKELDMLQVKVAYSADKVIRMPAFAHGGNHHPRYRFITARANKSGLMA